MIGHNIRRLITSLELRDARLDECLDAARELDLFYVPARYPNGLEAGTPGEAFSAAQTDRALALAEKILAAAETSVARSA